MSALRSRPSVDEAVRRRDLISPDLWERSLHRSRERRRVAEIHRRTAPRRKGVSLAVSAALLASPVFPRFAAAHPGSGTGTPTEDTGGGPTASRAPQLLERGDTGSAVKEAQRALGVTADGIFGPITEAAVKRFQGHEGLPRTGRVDSTTWMKLFSGNVTVVDAGTPEARAIQTAAGDEPTQPIPASNSPARGESGGPAAKPAAFQPAEEESGARDSGGERREPLRTRRASTDDPGADRTQRRESAGEDRDRSSGNRDRSSPDRDRPSSPDRDRPSGDRDRGATQPVSDGRDDSSSGGGGSCGNGDFARPVNGTVTSTFGAPRGGRSHGGIDIAAPSGTPIKAATCGRISEAGSQGGYGNIICVRASESFTTCYAHLSRFGASVGQYVKIGEVIGYVGCTGSCTGPHVHFEVRVDGQQVDPAPYLNGSRKAPRARSSSDATMAVRFTDSTRKTPAAKAAKREKVSRQQDEAAKDPAQQPQISTPAAGGEVAGETPTDQPAPTTASAQDPAATAPAPADPSIQAPGQEVDPSAGAVEDTTGPVEETTAPVEDTTGAGSPGTDTSTVEETTGSTEEDASSTGDETTGTTEETTGSTEEDASSSVEETTGTTDEDATSTGDETTSSTEETTGSTEEDASSTGDETTGTTDEDATSTGDETTGTTDEDTTSTGDETTGTTDEDTTSTGDETTGTTEEDTSSGAEETTGAVEETTGSSDEETDAAGEDDSDSSSDDGSASDATADDTAGSEEPAGTTAGG